MTKGDLLAATQRLHAACAPRVCIPREHEDEWEGATTRRSTGRAQGRGARDLLPRRPATPAPASTRRSTAALSTRCVSQWVTHRPRPDRPPAPIPAHACTARLAARPGSGAPRTHSTRDAHLPPLPSLPRAWSLEGGRRRLGPAFFGLGTPHTRGRRGEGQGALGRVATRASRRAPTLMGGRGGSTRQRAAAGGQAPARTDVVGGAGARAPVAAVPVHRATPSSDDFQRRLDCSGFVACSWGKTLGEHVSRYMCRT